MDGETIRARSAERTHLPVPAGHDDFCWWFEARPSSSPSAAAFPAGGPPTGTTSQTRNLAEPRLLGTAAKAAPRIPCGCPNGKPFPRMARARSVSFLHIQTGG